MYQVLFFQRDPIKSKRRYNVFKITGLYKDGISASSSIMNIDSSLIKYDSFYLIIRKDSPPHYLSAFHPLKGVIQFDDDWRRLKYNYHGSINTFVSCCLNDKNDLSNFKEVIHLLHGRGEHLRALLSQHKNLLPL